jgi:hypothetical protein
MESLNDTIDEIGRLLAPLILRQIESLSSEDSERLNGLIHEVQMSLLDKPGALIFEPNVERHEWNKIIIELVAKLMDEDQFLDEAIGGDLSCRLLDFADCYSERARMLRPAFVSVEPDTPEFKTYYAEAMSAWLYGLDTAALLICVSLLEDLLETVMAKIDAEFAYEFFGGSQPIGVRKNKLEYLIDKALNLGIVNADHQSALHRLRKLRNRALHQLRPLSADESLSAIQTTRGITEHLLNGGY